MVTEGKIEKLISSFDIKYSAGNDDIPIRVIKTALPFICTLSICVINYSLISATFPEKFRVPRVIPI